MIKLIKKILGITPQADLQTVIDSGATIVDVRTPGEYVMGHLKNAITIPLTSLDSELSKINRDKPVITCCASGLRSRVARSILLEKGYREVYNAGNWVNLKQFEHY